MDLMKDEMLDHSFIALRHRLFASLDNKKWIKCELKKRNERKARFMFISK